MLIRIFNAVIIALTVLIVFFITSYFYLGNKETHDSDVSENGVSVFIARTLMGVILGFLGCVVVLLGNLILVRRVPDKAQRIYRSIVIAAALSAAASVIGALNFMFF